VRISQVQCEHDARIGEVCKRAGEPLLFTTAEDTLLLQRNTSEINFAEALPMPRYCNMQDGNYNLSANLALLRMYSIYPEKTSVHTLSQLLVKAITRLPSTDFATLLHLIPERLQVAFTC